MGEEAAVLLFSELDLFSLPGSQGSQGGFTETIGKGMSAWFGKKEDGSQQRGLQRREPCPAAECFTRRARDTKVGARSEGCRREQRLGDATYQGCCLSPALAYQPHRCPQRGKLQQRSPRPGMQAGIDTDAPTAAHTTLVGLGGGDLYFACWHTK